MIETGDFIRTKDGYIGKVNHIIASEEKYYCCDTIMGSSYKSDIKKHSPNIIDLVEVGDYVNGYKILGKRMPISQYGEGIKTVLTHELYEMNCYKVGGE